MKLTDMIGYVDRIKPNAFTDEDKARWLSEVEGLVWTEVFLLDPREFRPYVFSASYTASGVCYPDEHTMRLLSPIPDEFSVGGTLTISGGTLYAGNAGGYRIKGISADGCEITVYETFSATGREEDTGTTAFAFDGSEAVLMVRPPHDKIYADYLTAMIDYGNGEYNKYQNTMQMFNVHWGELCRWVARTFRPADRDPSKTGAYLSAYAVAVKHGYRGSEEDWLRSLHGADGSSGVWISDDLSDWPEEDRHLWLIRNGGEEDEDIVIPDGLDYTDGQIRLMDGSEPVGDPLALTVGLPAVTTADNGTLLGVVNGTWAKMELVEWNGGSY